MSRREVGSGTLAALELLDGNQLLPEEVLPLDERDSWAGVLLLVMPEKDEVEPSTVVPSTADFARMICFVGHGVER
jgi:hypothetical protein